MIPIAMQLGLVPLPPRPALAPVRRNRLHVNAALTPPLPEVESARPSVMKARQQRAEVLRMLTDGGHAMRRIEVAAAIGVTEEIAGERLMELRKLGMVRMERAGRYVQWEAVVTDEEEGG